jgi:hypothetical protein
VGTRFKDAGRTMTGRLIQDLVGRAMIDEDFLVALVRDPDVVLAGFDLTSEEHAVIMTAIQREVDVPEAERLDLLQTVILKRWAT